MRGVAPGQPVRGELPGWGGGSLRISTVKTKVVFSQNVFINLDTYKRVSFGTKSS